MSKLSALVNKLTVFVGRTIRLYGVDVTGAPTQGYIELDDIIDNSKVSATDTTGKTLSEKMSFAGFSTVISNPAGDETWNIKHIGDIYDLTLAYKVTIDGALLSADRVQNVPDKDGTFAMLTDALIYKPTTQPAIAASTLTLDILDRYESIFEPRTSVGTRTISSNFTLAFSNDSNADIIHCVFQFTGTVVITMPATVDVIDSLPSFVSFDTGLYELTIDAGTNERVEFDFLIDKTSSRKSLVVSNKIVV